MANVNDVKEDLLAQIEELRSRALEAEEILQAIRSGAVDAVVVTGPDGDQVYTLTGADRAYRILFETMSEGAVILGRDGTVYFCNTALAAMLQTGMESVVGASILSFVEDSDIEAMTDLLRRGPREQWKHEISLKTAQGATVPCQISASPFTVEDTSAICMILTDLTLLKRSERKLIRSNRELEEFAYVASHDLQEPLRTIASGLRLLERNYRNSLDPQAGVLIDYAVEAAQRMHAMILDLLAYSRLSVKGADPEMTDCEKVLSEVIANLKSAIEDTGASITHDPLPTLKAFPSQLAQVFQNLLGNALRFRGRNPLRIHVSASRDGGGWVFSVKDNGIGIDPQHWERIFLIFHRVRRNREEGAGMGLAIVKKIIDNHGGRVWIDSELGSGSTFYFTIPERIVAPVG